MNSVQTQTLSIKGNGGGEAYIDFDFNPILKISTDAGNVIVMPSSDNKIIVKSTVDK